MDVVTRTHDKNVRIIDTSKPILISFESENLVPAQMQQVDTDLFDCILQQCEISRNRNNYPREDLSRSLAESRRVQEAIQNRLWMAEAEHPFNDFSKDGRVSLRRLFRVEPTRWAGRIDKYWFDGDLIRGRFQWTPNELGMMYKGLAQQHGSNIAFSLRAYTPNYVEETDASGQKFVTKKYPMYPITYDVVSAPGHRRARMHDPDLLVGNGNVSYENIGGADVFLLKNPVDEIKDFLHSEEAADFISDFYEVDFDKDNMFITQEGYLSVKMDEERRLNLPMNAVLLDHIIK